MTGHLITGDDDIAMPHLNDPGFLREIIESITIGVCLIDENARIIYSNHLLEDILDHREMSLMGMDLTRFIKDTTGSLEHFLSTGEAKPLHQIECKVNAESENPRDIHLSIIPLSSEKNKGHSLCCLQDSTNIIQMQLSLIREFAFQSEVSDLARDLRSASSMAEVVPLINTCSYHHTNFDLTGVIYVFEDKRKPIAQWYHDSRREDIERFSGVLKSPVSPIFHAANIDPEEFQSDEVRIWSATDFEEITRNRHKLLESVSIMGVPISVKGHGRGFLVGMFDPEEKTGQEDIGRMQQLSMIVCSVVENLYLIRRIRNQNEKLEETVSELKKANLVRDQFYRFLIHDLNKPLAAISGTANRLGKKDLPDPVQDRISRIYRSSVKLQGYVAELLDFEQIRRDELEFDVESFNAIAELDDCVDIISERFENCHVTLSDNRRIICDSKLKDEPTGTFPVCELESDRRYFQRILLNLMDNAGKYGDGRIDVTIKMQKGSVVISVWNNGEPIPEGQIENLFAEFSQGSKQISGSYGIGLASVRYLIQRLGGKIRVEPQKDGTSFIVSLPVDWTRTARVLPVH